VRGYRKEKDSNPQAKPIILESSARIPYAFIGFPPWISLRVFASSRETIRSQNTASTGAKAQPANRWAKGYPHQPIGLSRGLRPSDPVMTRDARHSLDPRTTLGECLLPYRSTSTV